MRAPADRLLSLFVRAFRTPNTARFLSDNPALLSDDVLSRARELCRVATEQKNERASRILGQVTTLLERARLSGVEGALLEFSAPARIPEGFAARADEELEGNPHYHPGYYSALGDAHRKLFLKAGHIEELRRSIELYERALSEAPDGSPFRSKYLSDLGTALWDLFEQTGEHVLLERSTELTRDGIALLPYGSDLWAAYHTNLGNRWQRHAMLTGNRETLEAAIDAYEVAARATLDDSPSAALFKSNLSLGLLDRFVLRGDVRDLERATSLATQAVTGDPDPNFLHRLGSCHYLAYLRAGDLGALDRAVATWRKAAAGLTEGSPELPQVLSSLSAAHRARHELAADRADLDKAVDFAVRAVATAGPSSFLYFQYAHRASTALLDRCREAHAGAGEDLETSISYAHLALRACPPGGERGLMLDTLGVTLLLRFEAGGRPEDLDEAISLGLEAVKTVSAVSANAVSASNNLASALMSKWAKEQSVETARLASHYFRHACNLAASSPESGLSAALNWAAWARGRADWSELAEAGMAGLQLARLLFDKQLLRTHKEVWLKRMRALPTYAAFAFIQLGHLEQAVEVLENGRALFLSEALNEGAARLDRLSGGGNVLAERVVRARQALLALELARDSPTGWSAGDLEQRLSDATEELRDASSVFRATEAGASLQVPMRLAEIREAASTQPIIYLLAGDGNGTALAVRGDAPVAFFVLPGFDERELREAVVRHIRAATTREQEDAIDSATRWLWDTVAHPLIRWAEAQVVKDETAEVPAVRVIPVGLLGLLPLHAAWCLGAGGSARTYTLDRLCITYLPNARAAVARRRERPDRATRTFLAISNPTGDLPGAAEEVEGIRRWFGTDARVLAGEAASRAHVLRELRSSSIVHFSCHGYADLNVPLRSGLVLAGGEALRLADLLQHDVELGTAVLSACETAVTDLAIPDEVVGLPTAFLSAGAAAVVASLWSVPDRSTARLMAKFYELWRGDRLEPAEALRKAQGFIRDAEETSAPLHWAAFVFSGRA